MLKTIMRQGKLAEMNDLVLMKLLDFKKIVFSYNRVWWTHNRANKSAGGYVGNTCTLQSLYIRNAFEFFSKTIW